MKKNSDLKIKKSMLQEGKILLMFSASWLNGEEEHVAQFKRLADDFKGHLKIGYFDLKKKKSRDIAISFGINRLPTYLFLNDGAEIGRSMGNYSDEDLAFFASRFL